MTFRAPQLLLLLAAVPLAALLLASRERFRMRAARRFVSEHLRGVSNLARPLRPWLLTAALLLGIVAIAGPSRGFTTVPVSAREANRIVVLDVSNSMLAQDVGASRLAAAKAIAHRIIDAHPGRVGLIEFEMTPEVVAPLTNDNDAVLALLDSVEAGDIGAPGTDLGAAVVAALRLANAEPAARADVVLISDGEEQGTRLREALAQARERGITISTVLVGSPGGSTIPTTTGVLRTENGETVTTHARPDALQAISEATGGTFLSNPFSERALQPLLVARGRGTDRQRNVRIPIDRYQWPLAAAFLALLCGSLANRGAE